jgi:hypothetical protein
MKIILTTTIVAILAIGLFGISNSGSINNIGTAYAQMNSDTGMMGNDTGGMMNATLAFAQDMGDGGMMGNDTMSMGNDTGMMMRIEDKGMEMMKLNGTINVETTIAEAFKSKVTTDIIGAIQAAQASVGANSVVKEAEMTHAHGYLVYKIMVVDENMKKHKVIVDPGNGQVLMQKEVTWYDEYKDKHKKMKYGDDERHDKYDKYGGDGDHGYDDKYDDKKKMMMMKDKKY